MEPGEQATIYAYNNITNYIGPGYFFHNYTNETKSIEEVLQIKNSYYLIYYCKNNICFKYNYEFDGYVIIQIPDENGTSKTIITAYQRPYGTEDIKTAYRCKGDVCVYEGCTHASQCLFGICALKDEVTNTTRDVPFDNHTNGLCRYNAQANITECDAVYVKQTLFRKSRAYMHCGKLKGASCVTDDECAYNLCANGRCARSSNGPSDSDNMIILVYIYLGITLFALVILCPSYCYCYIHQPKNRKKIVLFAVITTFLVLLLWIK